MAKYKYFLEAIFHFGMAIVFVMIFDQIMEGVESEIPFYIQVVPLVLSGLFANFWFMAMYKFVKIDYNVGMDKNS